MKDLKRTKAERKANKMQSRNLILWKSKAKKDWKERKNNNRELQKSRKTL